MELKVWVEGIQRVVCGITEQTTVQEVVIALAQATGRTGRYTLVEKWKDMEKLLPPSEHPIKVLEKWGEYASDVQFLLKRTGASTTSSDVENIKAPERNHYRQSLPPLAKNREKSEMLQGLKRKEPKRKSLTITGGTSQNYGDDSRDKRSQNSNGNNNRTQISTEDARPSRYDRSTSGSVPANVRKAAEKFSSNALNKDSGRRDKSRDRDGKSKSKHKSDKKTKEDDRKVSAKTPLMPPHTQGGRNNVSSATEALFPSETKSDVFAKSPIRKNADNQIKNVNIKSGGKVPLMPPTNKVLRNRNQSNSFDKPQASPSSPSSSENHSNNLSSSSMTPTPFSLPNENKLSNSSYRYGNSLPRSKKKSWSEANSSSVDDSKKQLNKETNRRSALMPPTQKQRAMTPNPQIHRDAYQNNSRHSYHPTSPVPMQSSKLSEQARAKEDFSKLVSEQQKHVEEQKDTISALDKQIQIIIDAMQQRDREIEAQITQLEEKNRSLEIEYESEYNVPEELSAEDAKESMTKRQMSNLQAKIDRSSADISACLRKKEDLTKAIAEESHLQRAKQQRVAENNKNIAMKSKKDIDHINWNLNSMKDEIERIQSQIVNREQDIDHKYSSLDLLNRELRQVNLQQFIRKTGSKVTVLPPETEESDTRAQSMRRMYESSPSLNVGGSRSPFSAAPPPPQAGNSEGVWV
uniref:ras association domain-containing protein 8-like n=1 Tax=Styela clava TaxID=7725 RepID=UPI00193A5579|nr:ras association domain-containing protein 8-like [Styela clava]